MSGSKIPPPAGGEPSGNDPSMEDILASIRRILSEEEPPAPPLTPPPEPSAPEEKPDDVLVLDSSMLVAEEAPAAEEQPEPAPAVELAPVPKLLAPETEAAASSSVGNLVRTLATERTLQVHRGGPTIEDIVREELRPLLKQWLDANLPDVVERLVRAEIDRLVRRAVP